ncbi:lysophospholipid acyltransferase family protein [Rhodopirellula sp. P2]|uniref:lysophospholipid acyltransferase family protein n=1 Tax=Rhodopirellula sp. P2 TaxID=2127060 RepID=UPI002367D2A3|nr:lysophospholipid acyltransferase family protein [Rhodopirellula sp. P2]WDQ18561.1 lysophospholipid acyltransferase family protein [Rhodopirellula sp. P2]
MKVPSLVNPVIGAGIAVTFKLFRLTFRIRVRNDQRERLVQRTGKQYALAILHAHQLAALSLSAPKVGAMVSRSRDGDLLMPLLRGNGCVPIRGSSGVGEKGGATALTKMIRHVKDGNPSVIAVDGPRGPRGVVQKGIAMVAIKADVPIVPVVLIPRRRWILPKAWDRMQILLPFTRVDALFGDPIFPVPGESIDDLREKVAESLRVMEHRMDPEEAERCDRLCSKQAGSRRGKNRPVPPTSESSAGETGDSVGGKAEAIVPTETLRDAENLASDTSKRAAA